MSTTDLIKGYFQIWNERDAAVREASMKSVLTDDVVYSDPDYAGLRKRFLLCSHSMQVRPLTRPH